MMVIHPTTPDDDDDDDDGHEYMKIYWNFQGITINVLLLAWLKEIWTKWVALISSQFMSNWNSI